jgi:hypothetical protein
MRRKLGLAIAAVFCFALVAEAGPARYNPRRAGHPLRIAAYAAHPFGVILDTLIFHPAWWIGQHEPFRTLFGVTTPRDDSEEVAAAQRASKEAEPTPVPEDMPVRPQPNPPPESEAPPSDPSTLPPD